MPDTRPDPWGLGVAPRRPRAPQRPRRRVRKGVHLSTLARQLGLHWRTLARLAEAMGIEWHWRVPLVLEDVVRIRAVVAAARAKRQARQEHRISLKKALAT